MELADHTFDELSRVIHRLTGLVVGKDKTYLVKHRLGPVLKSHGCASFDSFVRDLKSAGGLRLQEALIEAITTKETSFFRDHWFFDALREHVFPERALMLKQSGGGRHRVRFWSAAASMGQEAYSVAMMARELGETPGCALQEHQISVMASDISLEAIKEGRAGRFTMAQMRRGISDGRLSRHFQRAGAGWQIDPKVQRLVVFRRLDLLHLPKELETFDVILCRNVLIYFDQKTREHVYRDLYRLLEPGGWLALGSAESLLGMSERFETVKFGRAVFYRKPIGPRS